MTTTPTAPRLMMQFKARTPDFDENLHPRDRKGRFIETGAEVRIWGGQSGTVVKNVGGGRIEVERADGKHVIVHRNYLTVTASADGGDPIEDEADAPDVPVEAASPDAEEDPELADGEGQTLPDRGDAPDQIADTEGMSVGDEVGDYTIGEWVDGPSAIDGWVVDVTDSGGPIVRTEDGKDWPLLPDATMVRNSEGAPEAPADLLGAPQVDPTTAEPADLDDEQIAVERGRLNAAIEKERDRLIGEGWEDGEPAPTLDVLDDREQALAAEAYSRAGINPERVDEGPDAAPRPIRDRGDQPAEAPAAEAPPAEAPAAPAAAAPVPTRWDFSIDTDADLKKRAGQLRRQQRTKTPGSRVHTIIQQELDAVEAEQARRANAPEAEAPAAAPSAPEAAPAAPEGDVIDSVNPSSSGVFEEYASGREFRSTAPLADNMTTLAETEGVDPGDEVTLYRGIAEGDPDDGIRPGDFVTTNRQLAQDYAGTGNVVEMQARYGDVLDDRDEPGGEEYIYRPSTDAIGEAAPEQQAPEAPAAKPERITPSAVEVGDRLVGNGFGGHTFVVTGINVGKGRSTGLSGPGAVKPDTLRITGVDDDGNVVIKDYVGGADSKLANVRRVGTGESAEYPDRPIEKTRPADVQPGDRVLLASGDATVVRTLPGEGNTGQSTKLYVRQPGVDYVIATQYRDNQWVQVTGHDEPVDDRDAAILDAAFARYNRADDYIDEIVREETEKYDNGETATTEPEAPTTEAPATEDTADGTDLADRAYATLSESPEADEAGEDRVRSLIDQRLAETGNDPVVDVFLGEHGVRIFRNEDRVEALNAEDLADGPEGLPDALKPRDETTAEVSPERQRMIDAVVAAADEEGMDESQRRRLNALADVIRGDALDDEQTRTMLDAVAAVDAPGMTTLRERLNEPPEADVPEPSTIEEEVAAAREAGVEAFINDEMRAPALNETVLSMLAGSKPGDERTTQIMKAFTDGYDATRDDALSGLLIIGEEDDLDDEDTLDEGAIGAAASKGRTTTVTLPDGTTATRSSKGRTYSHVVVIDPATPEDRAAAYNRVADALDARADVYDAAVADAKVKLVNRGLHRGGAEDLNDFHTHEAELAGTEVRYTGGGRYARSGTYREVSVRSNFNGEALVYGDVPEGVEVVREHDGHPVVRARAYVLALGAQGAAEKRATAARAREEGAKPDTAGYQVVRWTSSADLGRKAADGEFSYQYEQYGRRARVVEVDTVDEVEVDPEKEAAADAMRAAVEAEGLDPTRVKLQSNVYSSTAASLRTGDVLYTRDDSSLSPARGGSLAPQDRRQRTIARFGYDSDARRSTIEFTDGTSTIKPAGGVRVAHVPNSQRTPEPDAEVDVADMDDEALLAEANRVIAALQADPDNAELREHRNEVLNTMIARGMDMPERPAMNYADATGDPIAIGAPELSNTRGVDREQFYRLDWDSDLDDPEALYAMNPMGGRPFRIGGNGVQGAGNAALGGDDRRIFFLSEDGKVGEVILPADARITPVERPAGARRTEAEIAERNNARRARGETVPDDSSPETEPYDEPEAAPAPGPDPDPAPGPDPDQPAVGTPEMPNPKFAAAHISALIGDPDIRDSVQAVLNPTTRAVNGLYGADGMRNIERHPDAERLLPMVLTARAGVTRDGGRRVWSGPKAQAALNRLAAGDPTLPANSVGRRASIEVLDPDAPMRMGQPAATKRVEGEVTNISDATGVGVYVRIVDDNGDPHVQAMAPDATVQIVEAQPERPDPVEVTTPNGDTRYGRAITDLRPGDRVHTQGGNMLRERLVGAEATASASPNGGVVYPFGNQVRTIDRIEGDSIYFVTDRDFIGGGQPHASIEEFRGMRDANGRSNPDRSVLIEQDAPEPDPDAGGDGADADHPAAAISNGNPEPITFRYVRNPASSQTAGASQDFGQDVEPAGRYLSRAEGDFVPEGWETGTVAFRKPLHMNWGRPGEGYDADENWKRRLSEHYGGLTGQALADAVRADGYDAIMTNDSYGDSEIVDLSNGAAEVPDSDTGGDVDQIAVGTRVTARQPGIEQSVEGELVGYDDQGMAQVRYWNRRGEAVIGTFNPAYVEAVNAGPEPDPSPAPVIPRKTYDGPNGTLTEGDVIARELRGQVVLERLVSIGQQSVSIRATDGHTEGYPLYGDGDLDKVLGKYRPATPEEVSRFEGTDADLRSLITPLPDMNADMDEYETDEALALAIKGIDDNITGLQGDEYSAALRYRARLIGEQNRRRDESAGPVAPEVSTEAVRASDLNEGDVVVFEDGTIATIEGVEPADDLIELEYRDSNGLAGSYFTDGDTTFQRVVPEGDGALPSPDPEPEQNPVPEVGRTQQVLAGNLALGDRIWAGTTGKVEVVAIEDNDADTVMVTFQKADRTKFTTPMGREAVLDRADDEFLPEPSPLDKSTATSRPVLYTYQRRNIVALGLDTDGDPMVAEAARRIRMRQPLAAAHSAALANRLLEMSVGDGVKPQRARMLARLAAANNAASIEAGGRGIDMPDMPNADRVTKAKPGDVGVGDQIAFTGLRGILLQGKVTNARRMMGGRLTEVTFEGPDGVERKMLLTRNTDVYVMPDLPEPVVVPQPEDSLPEVVDLTRLRVGDVVRVGAPGLLVDGEQSRREMTVVEVDNRLDENGVLSVVFDAHSPYSDDEEQRLVFTAEPGRNPEEVMRVGRGAESADQPRDRNTPPLNPEAVTVEDIAIGDWVEWQTSNTGRPAIGMVTDMAPVFAGYNATEGEQIGTKFQIRGVSGSSSWHTVIGDNWNEGTRLIKNDQNTILRLEEQKKARARHSRVIQASHGIMQPLEQYNEMMAFRIAQNALQGGGISDEHYGEAIWQAFTGGQDSTTSLDTDRLRAIGQMTSSLQVALSGQSSGPEHQGVRDAAAALAEKIVNDYHFRIQKGLMDIRPTEPGQTKAAAGTAMVRSIFKPELHGESGLDQRDLMALANGVVNAREAREAAALPDEERDDSPITLPEGTSLADRMAAYKARISGRFGFAETSVASFGDFDLDSLERGEVPEVVMTTGRARDKAADGGPGADTMAQLDTMKAAGADVAAAIDRKMAEDYPNATTANYDALMNATVAAKKAYEDASARRNEEYTSAKDRSARASGYVNFNQVDQIVYRRQDPPEGTTYEDARDARNKAIEARRDDPVFRAADDAQSEAYRNYLTTAEHQRNMRAAIAEARANATRSVLAEIRPMGGTQLSYKSAGRKNYEVTQNALRNGETMKAMRYAETNYPKEWLDTLNGSPKGALAIGTSKRGFFQSGVWIIRLSKDDNRNNESGWVPPRGRVATHELGHAMETVIPGLSQSEEAFLWSRTSEGEPGERTRTKRKRIDSSTSYLDEFKESYSGKDYADGTHYELFTTGMESLFAGSDYVDEDYRNWLLGTLALL